MRRCDVVHLHGLYLFHDIAVWQSCRRHGIPYVIRPHGTLEPYQRRRHAGRKRVYDGIVGRRILRDAALVHFTTPAEARNAEDLVGPGRSFVAALGVEPYASGLLTDAPAWWPDGRVLGYMGRISHKKRVDVLVEALAQLPGDVHLVIAGPDDERLQAGLEVLAARRGIARRVHFPGVLIGADKEWLLARATATGLASENENFAISVVESLSTWDACRHDPACRQSRAGGRTRCGCCRGRTRRRPVRRCLRSTADLELSADGSPGGCAPRRLWKRLAFAASGL